MRALFVLLFIVSVAFASDYYSNGLYCYKAVSYYYNNGRHENLIYCSQGCGNDGNCYNPQYCEAQKTSINQSNYCDLFLTFKVDTSVNFTREDNQANITYTMMMSDISSNLTESCALQVQRLACLNNYRNCDDPGMKACKASCDDASKCFNLTCSDYCHWVSSGIIRNEFSILGILLVIINVLLM